MPQRGNLPLRSAYREVNFDGEELRLGMSTVRRIFLFLAAFVVLFGLVVLVNQTLQLAELAERVHPVAGDFVFWGLVFLYLICAGAPIALFLCLPKRLIPPSSEEDPAFPAHVEKLAARLEANPLVAAQAVVSRADVEKALDELGETADEVVRTAGSRVFLTTAISQNGSLDALLVLGLQTRLIWDVAHVYAQRPSLRDMTYLYANVVATAFVAGEIDEVDLSEQIQPVLSSVLGSAASAVPGLQAASTIFVNSIVSGTTNAFLTLRVGLIAEEYCRALVRPEKRSLRSSAIARAAAMLGSIAARGAATVAAAVAKASARTVSSAVTGVGRKVKKAGGTLADRLPFRGRGGLPPSDVS